MKARCGIWLKEYQRAWTKAKFHEAKQKKISSKKLAMQEAGEKKKYRLVKDNICFIQNLNVSKGARNSILKFLHFYDLYCMMFINRSWCQLLYNHSTMWHNEYRRAWIKAQHEKMPLKITLLNPIGMMNYWCSTTSDMRCTLCRVHPRLGSEVKECVGCERVSRHLRLRDLRGYIVRRWMLPECTTVKDYQDREVMRVLAVEFMLDQTKKEVIRE
jgi:hypothetical protein